MRNKKYTPIKGERVLVKDKEWDNWLEETYIGLGSDAYPYVAADDDGFISGYEQCTPVVEDAKEYQERREDWEDVFQKVRDTIHQQELDSKEEIVQWMKGDLKTFLSTNDDLVKKRVLGNLMYCLFELGEIEVIPVEYALKGIIIDE